MANAPVQPQPFMVSRRGLLQGAAAATGALALGVTVGGAVPSISAAPLDSDLDILNYALTLELLELAAYKQAIASGVMTGRADAYVRFFAANEQVHVDTLTGAIRQLNATPAPMLPPGGAYNFASLPRDQTGLLRFLQESEALGISAYLGAAGAIKSLDLLEAALSIHAVEAEHAAGLADLIAPGADLFAPTAFEAPRTPEQVMARIAPFFQPASDGATAPVPAPAPAVPTPSAPVAPSVPGGLPRTGAGWASGDVAAIGLAAGALVGALALRRRRPRDSE